MTTTLFILNDAPYGSERSYNALRLALSLGKRDAQQVRVFLMGDAVSCAKVGQKVPTGYYNCEDMLRRIGPAVAVCGTCLDARGINASELIDSAHASTLAELTVWTVEADKVLVF